jgi:tagatose 1,6-diphosphate aldolase
MKQISLGKYRGLAQTSTVRSTFAILAMDHRNNLRNAMNPENPKQVNDLDIVNFKSEVVTLLSSVTSSVLLDPEFGAAQCIASGSMPGNIGLICALEKTGYCGDTIARHSKLLPGWSVEKARRLGASAIKLLVYYHPKSETANEIETLVQQVAEECKQEDIVLFLEPLSYSLIKGEKLCASERRVVVIETASRLSSLGADILKAEFPSDIKSIQSEKFWQEACVELTQASVIPWVLLSASVDFETYFNQAQIACDAGASGVAVGRAVWKEAIFNTGQDRTTFLESTAKPRMSRLTELCNTNAVPWKEYFCPPEDLGENWYVSY